MGGGGSDSVEDVGADDGAGASTGKATAAVMLASGVPIVTSWPAGSGRVHVSAVATTVASVGP